VLRQISATLLHGCIGKAQGLWPDELTAAVKKVGNSFAAVQQELSQ
jgi:Protein of unknown function (DUF3606)